MSRRKLFEETSDAAATLTARPAQTLIESEYPKDREWIRGWLGMLFALVVVMIAVGGLTRLTDSGLSITEWRPVTGAMPPMNAADWEIEFEKYKQIPEYTLQNKGMSLSEFKVIYWWEWGHRQLGRFIGVVWAVGFGALALRGSLRGVWLQRGLILGLLGGAQGAVGWWMVYSGLSGERLDVASYRLATHLCLAFAILGLIAWYMFDLAKPFHENLSARRNRLQGMMRASAWLVGVLYLQIFMGALVAGIDAGRNYTDWPLMAGGILPPDPLSFQPLWRNFFENDGLVQFMHRTTGYVFAGLAIWFYLRHRQISALHPRLKMMMVILAGQVILGVVTVMNSAPVGLALAHQVLAVGLWVSVLFVRYGAGYPPERSVRKG